MTTSQSSPVSEMRERVHKCRQEDSNRSNPCSNFIVLDGGMGHQLKALGVEIAGPVGSQPRFLGVCRANVDQPQLVVDAHKAFLTAGCDVITTNNYAAVPETLKLTGDLTADGLAVSCRVPSFSPADPAF